MSEPMPEPAPAEGGGNFLTQRYMGIPAVVWIGGAAVLAYLLFFRNKSSAATGSTANSGTETSGTVTLNAPPTQLYVPVASGNPVNLASGGTAPSGNNQGRNPGQGMQSGHHNPQPTPWTPSRVSSQSWSQGNGSSEQSGTGSGNDLTWTTPTGTYTGTASQFLQAFQETGENAGQIVPGGTGQPIPLTPGESYTSL